MFETIVKLDTSITGELTTKAEPKFETIVKLDTSITYGN